jgi:hypothetical protein
MARSGWHFTAKRKVHVGPFYAYLTQDSPLSLPRISSTGIKIGSWSRNFTRGTDTVDTPGAGYVKRKYR